MIPPEMLVWFGAALVCAGIVLLVGLRLTRPEPVVFVAPKYEPHVPVVPEKPPYEGRHRC